MPVLSPEISSHDLLDDAAGVLPAALQRLHPACIFRLLGRYLQKT